MSKAITCGVDVRAIVGRKVAADHVGPSLVDPWNARRASPLYPDPHTLPLPQKLSPRLNFRYDAWRIMRLLILFPLLLVSLAAATSGAGVNTSTLAAFQRTSGYAGAAYCSANYFAGVNSTTTFPPNDFDSGSGTQIAHSFVSSDKYNTSGLIILDHAHKDLVITFRGTISETDWRTNLDFASEDASDLCGPGCMAHSGFLGSWRGVSGIVTANWKVLQQQYPHYSTTITGHSLGGALAHLCAAGLKNTAPNATMSLFTFASPRVGNWVFAGFVNRGFGVNNYRVTHLNDPIPRLPGRLLGFVHTSPEYHIVSPHIRNVLSANKKTLAQPANVLVGLTDIRVLPGPESEAGNAGYSCANVAMHDEYFIHIAACVVGSKTPLLWGKLFSILDAAETWLKHDTGFASDICHILLL